MSQITEKRAMALGLAAVLCWSTVATAFKLALAHLDVFQLAFYATATATVALLAMVLLSGLAGQLLIALRVHWRYALLAGAMNPVIYYLVLFKAYDLLPAQVAQPINYTWSILLALMAIVFLRQRIRMTDLLAALICYGGAFVIATQGDLASLAGANLLGVALALLSTFIWAGYWILNVKDAREPRVALCHNFMVALPVTALLCHFLSSFSITLAGLGGAVYVGLMEMAITFVLWSTALRLTENASRVGNLVFLSPLISLVLINQVLGESIHPTTFIGLALILAGLTFQRRYTLR